MQKKSLLNIEIQEQGCQSGPRLLLVENKRKIEPKEIPATWNLRDNPAEEGLEL